MEEERKETPEVTEETQPEKVYTPRPAYQIWAARIGLAIVIIAVIIYYLNIAWGGM